MEKNTPLKISAFSEISNKVRFELFKESNLKCLRSSIKTNDTTELKNEDNHNKKLLEIKKYLTKRSSKIMKSKIFPKSNFFEKCNNQDFQSKINHTELQNKSKLLTTKSIKKIVKRKKLKSQSGK